jgi:ABC-type transporter Mla maintaining outer membrane lipid asymmetry ATPase subunit MlaF
MPATFAEEERKALTQLLISRDFITLFRGGAGKGKSFVLRTLVEKLNEAGNFVVTLAPQRQQVVDLAAKVFPRQQRLRISSPEIE